VSHSDVAFGMWHCVAGQVFPGVSKDRSALETSEVTHPTTHFYVAEDLNLQCHRCDNYRVWGLLCSPDTSKCFEA